MLFSLGEQKTKNSYIARSLYLLIKFQKIPFPSINFIFIYLFLIYYLFYLVIFGCIGSLLLHAGFL